MARMEGDSAGDEVMMSQLKANRAIPLERRVVPGVPR